VLARVAEAGIDPSMLKLELTESVLADDLDAVVAKMAVLKAHGIGFSLDDFGTGFSSLSYLRRLPLDQLKIDQSFVRNMLASPNDAAIAQTVVALGRTLGLQVIAEGVETDEQRSFLCEMGCEAFQGYLFSRPVPAAEFEAQVRGGCQPRAPQASAPVAGPAEGARDRRIEHT
jgi:EAL domain-containing protein (putative c-di-GMP-specific phosphodiesterase class I)